MGIDLKNVDTPVFSAKGEEGTELSYFEVQSNVGLNKKNKQTLRLSLEVF